MMYRILEEVEGIEEVEKMPWEEEVVVVEEEVVE